MNNILNIQWIDIENIRPYENNPRKNADAVNAVKKSIQVYGWKNPIVLDKNFIIVAGHTRYEAAKDLNMEKLPCVIASDLTDEQIKEFRLIDNKTSELSHWDYNLLEEELKNISTDLSEYGFGEMQKYLDSLPIGEDENAEEHLKDEYDEPKGIFLRCPVCSAVELRSEFKQVNSEDSE